MLQDGNKVSDLSKTILREFYLNHSDSLKNIKCFIMIPTTSFLIYIYSPRANLPPIAEVAIATDSLSTLVSAVQAAGLVETLSGEGTFTVFAPNNDAFAKLPADALADLLKPENVDQLKAVALRHVLPSVIMASDIPEGSTEIKTVGGETITVTKSENGVTVESSESKATVIATDNQASNGVIHVVDTVL